MLRLLTPRYFQYAAHFTRTGIAITQKRWIKLSSLAIFTTALPPTLLLLQSYFPCLIVPASQLIKFFPDCLRSEAKERPINFFFYRLNPHYFQSLPLQKYLFLYLKIINYITLYLKSSYNLEISPKTEIWYHNHCDISHNKKSRYVLVKPCPFLQPRLSPNGAWYTEMINTTHVSLVTIIQEKL
jgi:hypothetical protein